MRRQRQGCRRAPKMLLRDRVNILLRFIYVSFNCFPLVLAIHSLILQHKPDSDESISDEDDDVFPNNALSLDPTTNKQELPLPLRLDILKGISNQNFNGKGCSSCSFQKPLEDEVEMPDFKEGDVSGEVAANSTDEETNSADGDNTVLSTRQLHKYGPRSIRNEQDKNTTRNSEALLHSKVSASAPGATSSKANTSGIWKSKPSFPLPSVSCKCGGIGSSIPNIESLPEITKTVDPRTFANLCGNQLEDDTRIEISSDIEPAETEAFPQGLNLTSMDDLFDNLQDKTDQLFQKSSRSHLQEMVIDSEDSPEPVDSGSSSDNGVSDQHMKIAVTGKKMQTMAERFEEALGTSSAITEGIHVGARSSLRAGIFAKLQQMMLKEKETDMDFWKKLQAGARPDSQLGCIDVEIISRYRDGKLTVCHCSFGKNTENFLLQDSTKGFGFSGSASSQSTIIFSPRVCNNIELEVGKLIRIHPPWKEVQVGNDNIIILCTYFSETLFPL